jgi:glycosyltransferase involved in cell wall biosynthesis
MKKLKVYYSVSTYVSHQRVAAGYRDLIRDGHHLVSDVKHADIVVLHHEPHNFGGIYRAYPILKNKYVIGYCVWEASELPEAYKRSISYVQEVWTASRYCYLSFEKHHPRVAYIPHLTERETGCSDEDSAYIKKMINHEEKCVYYLAIAKVLDKRKNVRTLIEAFQNQREKMPNARLIIKTNSQSPNDFIVGPQVIYLPQDLTGPQMNALYRLAHVYVSAHHSEGWGLTLSDAMIFKKPVIATGYSGNLEFMTQDNSLLVDYAEEYIHPQDQFLQFNGSMKWAYPDRADLEQKLLLLYQDLHEKWVAEKVRKASVSVDRFNRKFVGGLVHQRLNEITV